MMIRMTMCVAALASAGLLTGCASDRDGDRVAFGATNSGMHYEDEHIPLSEVPDHVKKAAVDAVPGIMLVDAERETEHGVLLYELQGNVAGKTYEIEVGADGTVLEIEVDDDD